VVYLVAHTSQVRCQSSFDEVSLWSQAEDVKTVLAAFPDLCSASCRGKLYAQCCQWLPTYATL